MQADPAPRRASSTLALAEILEREVKDENAAVAELEKALDRNPRLVQAFARIEEILGKAKRWPELEQAYVRMIQRLPKTPDAAQARLGLWKTLGDLYRNVLQDEDGARTAYGVVREGDPGRRRCGRALRRARGEEAGRGGRGDRRLPAAREHGGPKAPKAASALVALHAARKQYDHAYSAAQVLANLLGGATPDEVAGGRPAPQVRARPGEPPARPRRSGRSSSTSG